MAAPEPPKRRPRRGLGALSVAYATTMWGILAVILKVVDLPVLTFATYRAWIGLAFYTVLLIVLRRRLPWSVLRVAWPGGAFFAADMMLTFGAFRFTSTANATIIGAISVVFIALGSARWFGESLDRWGYVLIGVSFIGVAVVAIASGSSGTSSTLGDLLATLGVLTWSGYWLFSKRARQRLDVGPLEYVTVAMLVAAPVITIVALASGTPMPVPSGFDWFALVFAAIVSGGIGHLAVAWSHGNVEGWLGAVITQSMPIIASVVAWVWLGEIVPPWVAFGGALVIGATAVIAVRDHIGTHEDEEPSIPAAV